MRKLILFSIELIAWLPFLSVSKFKKVTAGKPYLALFLFSFLSYTLHAQVSFQWVKQLGGGFDIYRPNAPAGDGFGHVSRNASSVATDKMNNIYVAGHYGDSTDFGNGVWMIPPSNHGSVMFLAKYDSAGNFLFVKNFYGLGNPTWVRGHRFDNQFIRIDTAGNVFLTAHLKGGASDLDPGAGVFSGNANMYYLIKLTANGDFVKAVPISWNLLGPASSSELAKIYKMTNEHFYVKSQFSIFRYNLNLDLDLTIDVRVSSGLEYNELNSEYGNGGINSFEVDTNGLIYCFLSHTKSICQTPNYWLVKYSANGIRMWTKPFINSAISLYKNRLKATGYLPYQQPIDVDPGIDSFFVSGSTDFPYFVAEFDTAGQFLHAQAVSRFVSKNYNRSGSVAATTLLGTNSVGDMNNTNDSLRYYYEGKLGSSTFLARGVSDFVVTNSDDYDNLISLTHFGGMGDERVGDWTLDRSGNMIVVGTFSHADDCDYDPGPNTVKLINTFMVSDPVFYNYAQNSIFLLKLKLNP